MTPRLSILLALLAAFGLTFCHAEPVAEPDIRKCHGNFRINAYLETAAALEAMPKRQAIGLLNKWAHTSRGYVYQDDQGFACDYTMEVITLCRMLFTPESGETLRRPNIGGTSFIGGPRSVGGVGSEDPDGRMERAMYAKLLDPIALIDGIPLLVAGVYFSSGPRPETAAEYLDYCIGSGVWGKIPFRKATKEEMESSIRKYQTDYALRSLDKSEIKCLVNQMEDPPASLPKATPGVKRPPGYSDQVFSYKIPTGQKLIVTFSTMIDGKLMPDDSRSYQITPLPNQKTTDCSVTVSWVAPPLPENSAFIPTSSGSIGPVMQKPIPWTITLDGKGLNREQFQFEVSSAAINLGASGGQGSCNNPPKPLQEQTAFYQWSQGKDANRRFYAALTVKLVPLDPNDSIGQIKVLKNP